MMSLRKPLGAAALLAALAVAAVPAQTPSPNFTGFVRDAAQAPIAGARVSATHSQTGATSSATTGADGAYSLALEPGSYSVTVTAPGYWGPTRAVDITAGGANELDFELPRMATEVVTVTATKHEAAPIDVPFSLVALSEQGLRDRGADNIEDVAANVGSFTVQSLGPGQSQVAMRGVSAGQIARDQPGVKEQVGIYLDESPVSLSLFTPDLDLVDVDRVEVLRGPQGTLFGAGSVTGTVRYVTRQPVVDSFEGFVDLGGAGVQDGSAIGDLKAAANVPLGDTSAARFVGYYSHLAGYTDAVQPDLSTDEDVNEGFRTGGRLAFAFAPTDRLTITPRLVFQRVERDGWNLQDIYNILANPFTTTRPAVTMGEREEFTQLDESFSDDFALGDVTLTYDFDAVTLTSITSYLERDILVVRDTTALSASFTGGTAGFPEPVYTLDSPLFDKTDAAIWTQEIRLSGERDRFQWLAGIFYSNIERDYGQDVKILGFTAATGIPTQGVLAPEDSIFFSQFDYELEQVALFGEATFPLTDRFSLTAGLRGYDYEEDKEQLVDGLFGAPANFPVSVLSLPGSTEASGVAPRLIATWRLSEGGVVNALVSKGFRLGGINDPLNEVPCSDEDLATFGGFDTWDDETVWNYEVGFKSKPLAGNSSVNVSAFTMDISDLQTTVTAGTCTSRLVINVPEARSSGVELDFNAAPSPNFDIGFSGSFVDSELRSTVTSTDLGGNVSVVSGIEAGRRLPTVPELQAALSAIYRWDFAGAKMYVTGTYQYIGSRYTQVGDEDLGTLDMTILPNTIGGPLTQTTFTYDPRMPAYDILNLRLGMKHGRWDVAAYVNNALDESARLALERERGTLARIGYLTNQPRTVGVTARVVF